MKLSFHELHSLIYGLRPISLILDEHDNTYTPLCIPLNRSDKKTPLMLIATFKPEIRSERAYNTIVDAWTISRIKECVFNATEIDSIYEKIQDVITRKIETIDLFRVIPPDKENKFDKNNPFLKLQLRYTNDISESIASKYELFKTRIANYPELQIPLDGIFEPYVIILYSEHLVNMGLAKLEQIVNLQIYEYL